MRPLHAATARDELGAAGDRRSRCDQFGSSWYLVGAGGKTVEPESSQSNSRSNSGPGYGSSNGATMNGGGALG